MKAKTVSSFSYASSSHFQSILLLPFGYPWSLESSNTAFLEGERGVRE